MSYAIITSMSLSIGTQHAKLMPLEKFTLKNTINGLFIKLMINTLYNRFLHLIWRIFLLLEAT
jgi:hypothetical protein